MTRPRSALFLALAGMLAVCLALTVSLAALNSYAISPLSPDMPVQVCAGLTTSPRVRVGLGWYSAIMSYLPPLMVSPWAVCVHVPQSWIAPWLGSLAGEWMFPP